jgi:hypothetical protein
MKRLSYPYLLSHCICFGQIAFAFSAYSFAKNSNKTAPSSRNFEETSGTARSLSPHVRTKQSKKVESWGSCPKSLNPGFNCEAFSSGCIFVPGTVTEKPLIYLRGNIQSNHTPPESTEDLFFGSADGKREYGLGSTGLNRIIFATHGPDVAVTANVIDCMNKLSGTEGKIDVASHSGGYLGLYDSRETLKGRVAKLELLDNFYNSEKITSSISTIGPDSCEGFYTASNQTNSGTRITSILRSMGSFRGGVFDIGSPHCVIEKADHHITSIRPFLYEKLGETGTTAQRSLRTRNSHI